MKTNSPFPTTSATITADDRRVAFFAAITAGRAPVAPSYEARDFAGDPESYRNEDGRPGAKDHKPQRGGKRGAVWIC